MGRTYERHTWMAEFELVEDEGFVVAFPVGLEGGTQGRGMRDAAEMAADWLAETGRHLLMLGEDLPALPLGTEPARGGRMLAVCASVSLADVAAVEEADAARLLGADAAEVGRMCAAGLLEWWRTGSGRMVTLDSIVARLEDRRERGGES